MPKRVTYTQRKARVNGFAETEEDIEESILLILDGCMFSVSVTYRTYRKIRITKCSKDTFNDSYPPVMVSLTFPGTSTRYHAMTPPTNIRVCTSARRLTRTKQGPFWFVITYMARCTSKSPSVHGEDSCDVRCSIEQLTHE
jgi:hypothetical protein